jgi:aryl-alcohol dehydrogenase-like predicted oxidoreductase
VNDESLPGWARKRAADAPATLALGTMNFGKRTPEPEARRIVDRALDLGITLFDTANAYNAGESERILGRALGGRRHEVAIATKVGFDRVQGKAEGLGRAAILSAIDRSLERLGTDYVDLYYLHVPDPTTPQGESLDAMSDLVKAGKVRHVGISNYASWQILEMLHHTGTDGAARPVVAQQLYNLLIRQLDVEYLRFAEKYGLHTTVYNPLAGGLLSGRYAPGADVAKGSRFDGNKMYQGRYWTARMLELTEAYAAVARDEGMSLVELAYAWLAGVPGVDSILVGPGSVPHLEQAAHAVGLRLSADASKRVEALHREYLGTETHYAR